MAQRCDVLGAPLNRAQDHPSARPIARHSGRMVRPAETNHRASRRSWSARLGTTKDARKIGRKLFPVHRNAMVSPSAASKVSSSAGVSATANLQGVTARFDWYLDRVVHVDRTGTLTVDHDVVRATSNLDSDCFVRQLQCCRHRRSPMSVGRATTPSSAPEAVSACRPGGRASQRQNGALARPDARWSLRGGSGH